MDPRFDKEKSNVVAKKLFEMFPKKNHNLIMSIEGRCLVLAGTDNQGFDKDTYFSIVKLEWEKEEWQIYKHDLNKEDRVDLQELLHMFTDRLNRLKFNERIEDIRIKVGSFFLIVKLEKIKYGETQRKAAIKFHDKELITITIGQNGVNDLLSSIMFVSHENVQWAKHNVAAFSDRDTFVFIYGILEDKIEVCIYGNGLFDIKHDKLDMEEARQVFNGEYQLEIPNSNSRVSTAVSFHFSQSVALQIFLKRGKTKF